MCGYKNYEIIFENLKEKLKNNFRKIFKNCWETIDLMES